MDGDPVLGRLVGRLRTVVPSCIGAYLHGSSGDAHLRPQSDVDVLAVSEAPLSGEQRDAVTSSLLELSGRYPRPTGGPRPIELTIVVRSEVVPWRYPPRCELQYGEWLRADIEAGQCLVPFSAPDLTVLIAMVLQCDAPIFGPRPRELLQPAPTGDVVRATVAAVPDLLHALDDDTTNVLLTLARVWRTCRTGELVSKDEAAGWVLRRVPHGVGAVVDRARAAYLDGTGHRWGSVDDETRHAARFLARAIEAASAR